jgi:hypothetical protein
MRTVIPPLSRHRGVVLNKAKKGKSQIWESKIWSRGPRDSNPRKTTLGRTNGIYKRQTRPLVREDATEKQDRNCQKVINIWSWAKTYWLTDRQSQCDFDFGLERLLNHKQRLRKLWQETREPACKTAVNWVTKTIRRIAWNRAPERWETKIENCEVTPQQYGLLRNASQGGVNQRQQLQFMVL